MEPIIREGDSHLPYIYFCHDGNLKMEGRCIPENAIEFFDPLLGFVRDLKNVDVKFELNLEYFNTSTSKKLMELFKTIDANNNVGNILVNWHFEEGDEDSVEMAEIYEENVLRMEFRYLEYAEVAA